MDAGAPGLFHLQQGSRPALMDAEELGLFHLQ
jgi:hypothetical protein